MGTGAMTIRSEEPEDVEVQSRWNRGFIKIQKEIQRFKSRRLALFFGKPLVPGRAPVPRIRKPSTSEMKRRYIASPTSYLPDEFVLYRVIGNDLVPRHSSGQSYNNVAFILKHEPAFPNCEKRWIVNRIADADQEAAIIKLLEEHDQPYLRIRFDEAEYSRIGWDTDGLPSPSFQFSRPYSKLEPSVQQRVQTHLRRLKNLYVMNNNGARNAALRDGRNRAKWVLPFDGNCYFTAQGFQALRDQIVAKPWYPYFIVPMARITRNSCLLEPDFAPDANEEPQIVFRSDALEMFDERIPYGRRPKVELLWRLVVPGPWDRFSFDTWDRVRPIPSPEAGQFRQAGWVARLESGRSDLEVGGDGSRNRSRVRNHAITATLDHLDSRALYKVMDPSRLVFYDIEKLEALALSEPSLASYLQSCADEALRRGPQSVVEKTTLPPSGNHHDYWHPAPYWWPNPSTPDGLPFIRKDGQRVPGTALYEVDSARYDRTALQHMLDDTVVLALAGVALENDAYLRHAASLVRTWFINPQTRMNPHLTYAQVRRGHNGEAGFGDGIIEMRDIYLLLDAVRLLTRSDYLPQEDIAIFRTWLADYASWLDNSTAGRRECLAENNHGTFYDVQAGAIAASVRNRARQRMLGQFSSDGSQPHELQRTKPRHYVCFGLAGWTILARVLGAFGDDLWHLDSGKGGLLAGAFEWLARADTENLWPRPEIDAFLSERMEPLWVDCRVHFTSIRTPPPNPAAPAVYHPDYGIAPFWILAQR
jgi:hypothetical protein